MNPSGTGTPERELRRRNGSRTLESHLLRGKIKRTGGISRCREECSSKSEYGKKIKNPTDHLNYGHSHQKLRHLGGGWAPRPRFQRVVPGLGGRGGAETALEV